MKLYIDTSALIKRYIREPGSEGVAALFEQYQFIGTAAITPAEMASGMAKAGRMGWVEKSALATAWHEFSSHWASFVRIPVSEAVIERAAELIWRHPLRAYDAVQLASAMLWKEILGEEIVFASFDQNLNRAAELSGLVPWPSESINP